MKTTKEKISPRVVMNGQIRFGGRPFACPELVALNNTTVCITYNSLADNTIDVLDEDMDVVCTASALVLSNVAKAVA
jgi:hypothetical protein